MREIVLRANAKLNLALDVTGKRADGYHVMDMVNLSVSLCDEVRIAANGLGATRLLDEKGAPVHGAENNLAVRASRALARATGRGEFGCDITLKKRIPSEAGLGGGSADAAAVLRGLTRLFSLDVGEGALLGAAESVGADVPFCATGGAMWVGGIGEVLRPVPNGCKLGFVILMPQGGRSTAEAFRRLDGASGFARPDCDAVERALAGGDAETLAREIKNVFETSRDDPVTARLKEALLQSGALGAALTGSGAAVYGLFDLSGGGALPEVACDGCRSYAALARPRGVEVVSEG